MIKAVLPTAVALVAAAAVAAGPAVAHVTVQPAASRPADRQIYTVLVPNERETATTSVRLQIPEGFDAVLVEEAAPWRARVVTAGGTPKEIRWTGGRIPPEGYRAFRFVARNPVRQGPVAWKTIQGYAGGEAVRWIGAEDSETPAATTTLSETAAPVDVVSTHGEEVTPAAAPTGAGGVATARGTGVVVQDAGRDGLTLGLAIAALAAALGGLGVALRRR